MDKITEAKCPLCGSKEGFLYSKDKKRIYIKCRICKLVYVPKRFFISAEAEKKRYDCHRNFPDDKGYITYLKRLLAPLLARIDEKSYGLDFGSGPLPVFAGLLEKKGHRVETFDIFYDNRPELLLNKYDFITVCEVIEHLHDPIFELTRLFSALKENGVLAIMTQPPVSADRFLDWSYKNDPTHVVFFSDESFQWIAEKFNCNYSNPGHGVFFLKKGEQKALFSGASS